MSTLSQLDLSSTPQSPHHPSLSSFVQPALRAAKTHAQPPKDAMNHTIPDPPLTFYPAYCFALSPTYHTWARLTAADVHALTTRPGFEGQNLYFNLNHPIKWIRLVGAIVALDSYERRLVLTLDDSSGATIELTCAKNPSLTTPAAPEAPTNDHPHPLPHPLSQPPAFAAATAVTPSGNLLSLEGMDVGTVVKAKGGIGEFRGTRQLVLERIAVVESTDVEVRAWEEAVRFRMEVLDLPWVVEEGVRRRLEVEAVKGREEKGRKRRRVRDRGEKGRGTDGVGDQMGKERERRRRDKTVEVKGKEGHGEEEGRGRGVGEAKERRHKHRHGHRHKRRESDKENVKGEGR